MNRWHLFQCVTPSNDYDSCQGFLCSARREAVLSIVKFLNILHIYIYTMGTDGSSYLDFKNAFLRFLFVGYLTATVPRFFVHHKVRQTHRAPGLCYNQVCKIIQSPITTLPKKQSLLFVIQICKLPDTRERDNFYHTFVFVFYHPQYTAHTAHTVLVHTTHSVNQPCKLLHCH